MNNDDRWTWLWEKESKKDEGEFSEKYPDDLFDGGYDILYADNKPVLWIKREDR